MLGYLNFLAGIALLLLGIRSLRHGSERLCGARLRRLLQSATQSRVRALATGVAMALLMPSSTGVALLAVEAINAGYMTFQQVLALMLGANIGFTLTVQLLAFKFYAYYGLFLVAGTPLFVFSRRHAVRGAGQLLLGVGFLLLSIQTISLAVAPLRDNADVREVMQILAAHPVWLVAFATVLELILQSPTATIGIAIALCAHQVLPVRAALAVVLGANIGVGVTALIAGFARVDTRRMAVGNLLFKLAGAAVCIPLVPQLMRTLDPLSLVGEMHDTQMIANAHTLFNVTVALVFLPVVPVVARLLQNWLPARETAAEPNKPRYLDPTALDSPPLALGQAVQEILHMAGHVRTMLRDSLRVFQTNDEMLGASIQQHDDVVDALNDEIKAYLTKLSEQALNRDESHREMALLTFAYELETIGDIIDKNLMELGKKKIVLGVHFSKDGWDELQGFFQRVLENYEIAVAAFANRDRALAEQLLRHEQHLTEQEQELRNRHFHRLQTGLAESFETSAIHLDVLTHLKHINTHLTAAAYPILEIKPAS